MERQRIVEISLSNDLYARLEELATAEDRSLASIIRMLATDGLQARTDSLRAVMIKPVSSEGAQ